MRRWLGAIAGAIAITTSLPFTAAASGPSPLPQASELQPPGRVGGQLAWDDHLGQLLALQAAEPLYAYSKYRSSYYQDLAFAWAFVGEEREARVCFDRAHTPDSSPHPAKVPAGLQAVPAVDGIAALAERRQVVFINEAHHLPYTRMLTIQLLPRLRRQGFRYLALEGLSNPLDPALAAHGYLQDGGTGYYTSEPTFGELIREAVRLGFVLVPYECTEAPAPDDPDPQKNINTRERGQCRNLIAATLAHDPHARILVHVGYNHLDERTGDRAVWLAARFKRATGIDPLTIDQTVLCERGDPRAEHPAYGPLLHRLRPERAMLLRRPAGKSWEQLGLDTGADELVLLPRTAYREGRPTWRFALPGRRTLRMDAAAYQALRNGPKPMLWSAYAAGETGKRVPLDRVFLPDNFPVPLVLGAGGVDLVLTDATGREVAAARRTLR